MATKTATMSKRSPKSAAAPMPETPNPVDIAMLAAVSGKPLPEVARRLLDEQADLLHAQCTELRIRQIGERVRAALWAILAIVALALSGLVVTLLVHAARSDALIVESFRVPPALAAQGLSGEVVATQVLDKLAEMQDASTSVRAASSYDNNWGDELKIDIPNTGATADQIWKLLRSSLGKETRISGEVVNAQPGLALTTRVGGTPGRRFVSKTADLDALVTQGAEVIFQQSQPYRYGVYLLQVPKRFGQGMELLEQLTRAAAEREHKWAFSGLSYGFRMQGQFGKAVAAARKALAIDPTMIPALANLASADQALGRDQEAVDAYTRSLEQSPSKDYNSQIVARNGCTDAEFVASASRDPKGLDQAATCEDATGGDPSGARLNAILLRHDAASALAFRTPVSPNNPAPFAAAQDASARLAGEMERPASSALSKALEEYRLAMAPLAGDPVYGAFARAAAPTGEWPAEAEVLIKLGEVREATDLLAKTPGDCYYCVRMRGLASERAGNLREAQRWYAEAARQAPRLAPAFADWGRLLVKGGRFDSAQTKLREASRLAPNWADPLKYWGDALAGQGKRVEAIGKYDAALKLAPQWQEAAAARARLGTP